MIFEWGKTYPLEGERPLGGACDPVWYILVCPSGGETGAEAWLRRVGAADVWHPVEKRWRKNRGKRNKVPYWRSVAPGYVFALFEREIRWHLLFEQAGKRLYGVVSRGREPYPVDERVLGQMRQVPGRIALMREREQRERMRAWMEKRPEEGQKARLIDGPLAGSLVDVERIDAGIAYFLLGSVRGSAAVDKMERE